MGFGTGNDARLTQVGSPVDLVNEVGVGYLMTALAPRAVRAAQLYPR